MRACWGRDSQNSWEQGLKQCCGKRLLSIRSHEDGILAKTVENTELKPLKADLGVLANTKVFWIQVIYILMKVIQKRLQQKKRKMPKKKNWNDALVLYEFAT